MNNITIKPVDNKIDLITLDNGCGLQLTLCSLGASVWDIQLLKNNQYQSVVLRPEQFSDFAHSTAYFGKTIGRTAGRIANGAFKIAGNSYKTRSNWQSCSLHGGKDGLSEQVWYYDLMESAHELLVTFSYFDPAMHENYPGALHLEVTYGLSKHTNTITITYHGTTDQATLCNMTNHTYFNLNGFGSVLEHLLTIKATHYTVLDDLLLPVELTNVNSVMDFSQAKKIGDAIDDASLQAHTAKGYDHFYLFDEVNDTLPQVVLQSANFELAITTTNMGVVVYTSNYPEPVVMNNGKLMEKHGAVCLECQGMPNGINFSHDPAWQSIITPDKSYSQKTVWQFRSK